MLNTPEERARAEIDRTLAEAGWIIQNRDEIHLPAAQGVAVREYPLSTGEADYLPFIDEQPVGDTLLLSYSRAIIFP